ncbi:hypothetical protein QVD17_16381 [Tagetes erecta]|uniref:Uncharacterized protein n=1 Tax=Tagetes erecta TaxID=13708 RepID=A0AAD8KS24_TARER|nr:hypothetical protein QVD17_16381 [Tagetes erecta]
MDERFFIGENLDKSFLESLYVGFSHIFSIKLHHGGSLTKFPGRIYQRAIETFVDMLDVDKFSVHALDMNDICLHYIFMADELVEQLQDNPKIPIKAVQEQFQTKFEVGVSFMKALRAKSIVMEKIQGDYSSQY